MFFAYSKKNWRTLFVVQSTATNEASQALVALGVEFDLHGGWYGCGGRLSQLSLWECLNVYLCVGRVALKSPKY